MYRSAGRVQPGDGRRERSALTTIYFLLTAGRVSRWHQVLSDEVWHFYEGDPLELWVADAAFDGVTRRLVGPAGDPGQPVTVVAAREWQAARSTGAYTLAGCTVGPGFEFDDFQMIEAGSELAATIRRRHPSAVAFL